MSSSVSFKDYDGVNGFGMGTTGQVEELNKALNVSYARPPVSGGDALRVESLEATLRTVTFTVKNIKLWPKIPKLPAFSTVEDYNILQAYGDDSGMFTNGGELPSTQDSSYLRKTQFVKFIGTTREVTHPTTMVRAAHGDVLALEAQNGAMQIVRGIERSLFTGRSDVVAQEWDGLSKQMFDGIGLTDIWNNPPAGVNGSNSLVIDLRGGSLTEELLELASNTVTENYGTPSDLHITPRAASDLTKTMYPRERIQLPAPVNGRVGYAVSEVLTSGGVITLNPNVFLRAGHLGSGVKAPPVVQTSANAPNPPTSVTPAVSADATNVSLFSAGDAGNYNYAVTALNRFGESTAVAVTGVTVAAGNKVVLTIVDGAGANPATGYRIYRSDVGQTATKIMTTIPRGLGAFTDFNFWLPGTTKGYMVQQDVNFFSFRQLAPMLKVPLATVAISIRWAQILYGTPIVYAPKFGVQFINVKES